MKAIVGLAPCGGILASSSAAPAEDDAPGLSGRVFYADGECPAGGLQVLLFDLGNQSRAFCAVTDSEGSFALGTYPAGAPDLPAALRRRPRDLPRGVRTRTV